jgi:hypothetical protein
MEVVVKDGQNIKHQGNVRPAEQADFFLPEHHPGYISWAQCQRHQDIGVIRASKRTRRNLVTSWEGVRHFHT